MRATEGDWLAGIAASPGVAVGPVFQYRPRLPDVVTVEVADPVAEGQRLRRALEEARLEIEALRRQAISRVGAAEAAIFEAHALFLQDPDLVDAALATIERERCNAEAAWNRAIEETAAAYRQMEDGYMRARAADVLDAGRRVLRQLMDLTPPSLSFEQPVIVLAADLTPSDTARLDPTAVLGIGTEVGGPTAHSAILARALGIPAVVGLGPALETIPAGQLIALDGSAGRLWPAPDTELLTVMEEKRARWQEVQAAAKRTSRAAAVTQDGRSIEVAANIGGPNDVPIAREYGAEGVGLFRTEFLFLDRETAPSEAEQVEAYRQAAAAMSGWPVIVRTLDVGGDKPLPYADLGREENPFLGWRGIRFCLDRPEIFKPQLRAILRASHDQALKLMFPMIGTLAELRAAKRMLAEARAELDAEGVGYDRQLEVGIMVEVPAAATVADRLASEVDFFSIGTNDLSQYVMAADRGNARVAPLADAFQPAVLRLIQRTVEAAHAADIWVGMCGELAGNALATPLLVGLGLDELSMNAPAIPAVKERIRSLHLSEARQLAPAVLDLDSADAVVSYLESL
ncbi:MAG: phosphoenolpyruvate--protein phosphotransferase [Candidatus Promineifilaceae bacterium]|nr:phosphoenolpyruvate--protein phosphotransferase [Candidatus Promineifilaceae bacterium]